MIKLVLVIEEDKKDKKCVTTLQKVISHDSELKPSDTETKMADEWHKIIKIIMEQAEGVSL